MQTRYKVIICVVPYALAGYLWFGMASPAMTEESNDRNKIQERTKDLDILGAQLKSLRKVQTEQMGLSSQIEMLRRLVPKTPDMDLLIVDIEKMALDSDLDVYGVVPPDSEALKKVNEEMGEDKKKATPKPLTPPPVAAKTKVASPGDADVGLSTLTTTVKLVGDFPSLIEFMKKLENYKRVIGVNHIEVDLPEASQKKSVDPKMLKMSFLMTAYYLP